MENIMSARTERNILVTFIVLSIIFILIAIYFFVIKNPKNIMLYVMQGADDSIVTTLKSNTHLLNNIDRGFTFNGNVSYYYKTPGTMEITKNKTKVTVPSYNIYSNDFNMYINKNKNNVQDILKLTLPKTEQLYYFYHRDGVINMDVNQFDQFVEIKPVDANLDMDFSMVADSMIIIYERVVNSFINQLNRADFYIVKDGNYYDICLLLNGERIKKYFINALEDLVKDNEFVSAYMQYYKQINPEVTVNKQFVQQKMAEYSKIVDGMDIGNERQFEIRVVSSDIINRKVDDIYVNVINDGEIVGKGKIMYDIDYIAFDYDYNSYSLKFKITKENNGYELIIKDNNYTDIQLDLNIFNDNKSIDLIGKLKDNKATGNVVMNYVNATTYDIKGQVISKDKYNNDVINISVDAQVVFDTVNDNIILRPSLTVEQSNNEIKQYVEGMYKIFEPKQIAQ